MLERQRLAQQRFDAGRLKAELDGMLIHDNFDMRTNAVARAMRR